MSDGIQSMPSLSTQPTRPSGRRPILLLGIGLSGALLYWSLQGIDHRRMWDVLLGVRVLPLLLAACLPLATFSIMALRSQALFAPIRRLSFTFLLKGVLIGFWGNNVLPLRAGELIRIDYVARRGGVSHSACLAAVAFERVLDMFFMAAFFLIIMPSFRSIEAGARTYAVLTVIAIAFVGSLVLGRWPELPARLIAAWLGFLPAALHERLSQIAASFGEGLRSLGSARSLLRTLALTGAYWALSAAFYLLMFSAFGLELSWWGALVVVTFTAAGTVLPSAPAAIGTYHMFSVWSLTLLGVPKLEAASFGLLSHAVSVVPCTLIGWGIVMRELSARRRGRGQEQGEGTAVLS